MVACSLNHWIGVAGRDMIFDVNAGDWLPRSQWLTELFPLFLEHNKCTGAWVRTAYEVEEL